MQDEVNERTIALSVKAGKLTAKALQALLKKLLKEANGDLKKFLESRNHGKQSVKSLMKKDTQLSNIPVTDGNIKAFERTAKKYGIDYALKKDGSEKPPKYLVFFKARDIDVMTQAFKEFSTKKLSQEHKPSIRKMLAAMKEAADSLTKNRTKVRVKERGQER